MSEPTQPPEAQLLERLRTGHRPKLSVRSAADQAGMSDARWRQIAKGFKYEAGGIRVPARAPADTLARMAKVVGATPDQLREAGRDDAAEEMLRADSDPAHIGAPLEPLPDATAEVVERSWSDVHALVEAVQELDVAPSQLVMATRQIIFVMSGFLIMRILDSADPRAHEHLLARVYRERDQWDQELAADKSPPSWLRRSDETAEESAATVVNDWSPKEEENAVETTQEPDAPGKAPQSKNAGAGDPREEDYDLAARDTGGVSEGEQTRRDMDQQGEAPDPEGPEDGA